MPLSQGDIMLKYILDSLKSLIRDVRASPLVEEGMLIGISIIMLTMLLSIVSGIFGGVREAFTGANSSMASIFEKIASELDKIWEYIASLFGG